MFVHAAGRFWDGCVGDMQRGYRTISQTMMWCKHAYRLFCLAWLCIGVAGQHMARLVLSVSLLGHDSETFAIECGRRKPGIHVDMCHLVF